MQRAGFHLGNWSDGPEEAAANLIRECKANALLAMENVAPESIVWWAEQPYVRQGGYLILRKHFASEGTLATAAAMMDWANGQVEMIDDYLQHEPFRRLYDAGRVGVKVFNEPNMIARKEGFGHDEEALRRYNDLFPQAAGFIKNRFPEARIVGYSLTPGNRDAYFSGAPQDRHYWFHGPEAARDNPTPAQIEAAAQSCLTRDAQDAMDWLGVHVYPKPGTWGKPWLGRRFEAYWRFLPDRLVNNTFILEASVADEAGQEVRAEETRKWLDMLRDEYPQVKAVTFWWLRPGDITWEKHYHTEDNGDWRPVAFEIQEFNLAAGDEPAPPTDKEPAEPDESDTDTEPATPHEQEPVSVTPHEPDRETDFKDLPLHITTPQVAAGEQYWRIRKAVALSPEEGSEMHHVFVRCFRHGTREPGVRVRQFWPDGENAGTTEAKPMREFGDWSAPLYGDWKPEEGPGPYSVEVADGAPSEALVGMGLPRKQHFSYEVHFEYVTGGGADGVEGEDTPDEKPAEIPADEGAHAGGAPTQPAEPVVSGTLRQGLLQKAEEAALPINPSAALYKAIVGDRCVPSSPEFTVEHEGERYVAQRALRRDDGQVRVYYARFGDWGNVRVAE